MLARFFTLIALMAGAGLLQVCSGLSISPECQSTVMQVAAAPEAACAQLSALVPLTIAGGNTSIVDAFDKASTGMCDVPACSTDTLSKIATNITAGCSADLAAIGWNQPALAWTASLQFFYPTVRKIACLKDSAGGRFCLTQMLSDIQDKMGIALTPANRAAITKTNLNATLHDPSVVCSDCMKKSYDIVRQDWSILTFVQSLNLMVEPICGPKFAGSA